MPRVFFITGSNRGIGHATGQLVLDQGEYLVATARNPALLSFNNTTSDNYLALKLDVTSPSDIHAALAAALDKFKRIDVVVNNVAFGLLDPLESITDAQMRHQFDVNFFPMVTITREAIRIMRKQSPSGGFILQVSSNAGLVGMPAMSGYCASKFALEGFTESVRQEVHPDWKIKIMAVQLGHCATEAMKYSMVYGEKEVAGYDHLPSMRKAAVEWEGVGVPPSGVAKAFYKLSQMEDPPLRASVTPDCLEYARKKLKDTEELLFREDLVELAMSSAA
ncbi:NAD(P)-binding protein [Polyplosphaeria fusca]|uniref:NAD(P)-binding protein n=1 Tax=Polyplosphaeria fusca TaxID=682080 RepID=A0A9P4QJA1_9PLEO|nr:NAD(P)-binding protein [Polyplosphaeria fusca]